MFKYAILYNPVSLVFIVFLLYLIINIDSDILCTNMLYMTELDLSLNIFSNKDMVDVDIVHASGYDAVKDAAATNSGDRYTYESRGGPGHPQGGSEAPYIGQDDYDTTKLADHLEKFKGDRLRTTGVAPLIASFTDPNLYKNSDKNLTRIYLHVRKEHPGFFFKNPASTTVDDKLVNLVRNLIKNYP